jgi:hypothetical protein
VTVRQLLLLATVRRWYLTILGFVVTAVIALQGMHAPGDYESTAGLVFLAPRSTQNPNGYIAGGNVISVAGVMSAIVRSSAVRDELRSAGLVDQYTIKLHNAGNQWADNYDRPVLDIHVWGADPDSVARSMRLLVARVDQDLQDRQRAAGSAPNNLVTTQLTPALPPVLHGSGSPMRAVAAALLGGTITTLTLVLVLDDALVRRRRRAVAGAAVRAGAAAPDTTEPERRPDTTPPAAAPGPGRAPVPAGRR